MIVRMARGKASVGEFVACTAVFWALALYLLFTGDPTHLLISGGIFSGGGLRDPLGVATNYFVFGAVVLCIAVWKRYLSKS